MITMVMPCKGEEDIFRVQENLAPSILKFLDARGFDEFIVICEEEAKNKLQPILSCLSSKLKVRFLLDSDFLPSAEGFEGRGWLKQQAIKLLSHSFVQSDWILTVDSDCYFVRESSIEDFINTTSNTKKTTAYTGLGKRRHGEWWNSSAKYLNMPEPDTYCFVTPFMLNRQVCSELCFSYDIEDALCSNGATEYSLYWTYLCATHTYTDYYTEGLISGDCLWKHTDEEDIAEGIKKQFEYNHWADYPMSLSQSNIGFDRSLIKLIKDEITSKPPQKDMKKVYYKNKTYLVKIKDIIKIGGMDSVVLQTGERIVWQDDEQQWVKYKESK